MEKHIAAVTFAVLVSASVAGAEDMRAKLREVCRSDYQNYCSTVQPGGGRIKQCLLDNRQRLSEQCRKALDEAVASHAGTNHRS